MRQCLVLTGYIWAERLYPILPFCIAEFSKSGYLSPYHPRILCEAKNIPWGTLKFMLRQFPLPTPGKGIKVMPSFTGKYPGYLEVDFGEHNGRRNSGSFAVTAIYTDSYSQWTVRVAGRGKNLQRVQERDRIARERIPLPVVQYHSDNDKTIRKVLLNE